MKLFLRALKETAHEWRRDEAASLAAALSYYMVFSLTPLLLLLISGLSLFLESQEAQAKILSFFTQNIGSQSTQIIQSMIEARPEEVHFTLTNLIGVVILFVAATTALTHLQAAFNRIWGVKLKPKASLKITFFKRLISLGLILLIGALILVSLVLSAIISVGFEWIQGFFPAVTYLFPLSEIIISIGIMSLLFTLMFQYLPDVKLKWRQVWLGGFLTGVLFFIGKTLIAWYFSVGNVFSSYGAAGSLIAILLWIYYSSLILFFGAEFTYVWMKVKGVKIKTQPIATHLHSGITVHLPHPPSFFQKTITTFQVVRGQIRLLRGVKRIKRFPKKVWRRWFGG